MNEENIRTYTFTVPGYIPGIPGDWPAGSWVKVDEETMTVLDWGPKPIEPVQAEPEFETPPALVLPDSAIVTQEVANQVGSEMISFVQQQQAG
ncbi:MAG TPA: hypothetical protein VFN23_04380 [Ktedonobacteraceae bacterium]|nr:hypothetical protein [Ktedonobacteraceae bacterium]